MSNSVVKPLSEQSNFLIIFQWLFIAVLVLGLLVHAWLFVFLNQAASGSLGPQQAQQGVLIDQSLQYLVISRVTVFIITAIIYCMCSFRMIKNFKTRKLDTDEMSPAGAVLWNFVPFASFFMPYRVMSIGWARSHDPYGLYRNDPPIMRGWWAAWVIALITTRIASIISDSAGIETGVSVNFDLLRLAIGLEMFSIVLLIVAAFSFLTFFKTLAKAHDANVVNADISVFGELGPALDAEETIETTIQTDDSEKRTRRRRRR